MALLSCISIICETEQMDTFEVLVFFSRVGGANPYPVPLGGSNSVGSWGYIEAFRELMAEGALERFDDVVVATGSGGTICGLAVANYLTGLKVK